MSAFYKWAPSSFHKNNFFERQLHINLFYYYKYLISSKLYLIVLLQIVIKMENRLPRRLKIPDTCIVRYYHHFYTGQGAKIPDSPVKYRTPGNPSHFYADDSHFYTGRPPSTVARMDLDRRMDGFQQTDAAQPREDGLPMVCDLQTEYIS